MHRRLFVFLCLSALALAGCSSQTTESGGADAAVQQDGQGQVARAEAGQASESGTLTASAAGGACGEADCVSLLFTGDFLMHNMLWGQAEADAAAAGSLGLDFTPLISEQRPYLDRADLAVCQMETVVADADGPFSGYPNFNVPPQILTAAAETGWDVCMTASNHSYDQGTEGLERTYRAVEAAGMGVTGTSLTEEEAAQPDVFTTANGARVAIITGTYGLNGYVPEHPWQVDMLDSAAMIAKAARAREEGADLVIANMHAGDEYVHEPSAQQVEVAHALVDSGEFDLVVGQHAHAVQPIEYYKGTWIVYGMGNNLPPTSPTTRELWSTLFLSEGRTAPGRCAISAGFLARWSITLPTVTALPHPAVLPPTVLMKTMPSSPMPASSRLLSLWGRLRPVPASGARVSGLTRSPPRAGEERCV